MKPLFWHCWRAYADSAGVRGVHPRLKRAQSRSEMGPSNLKWAKKCMVFPAQNYHFYPGPVLHGHCTAQCTAVVPSWSPHADCFLAFPAPTCHGLVLRYPGAALTCPEPVLPSFLSFPVWSCLAPICLGPVWLYPILSLHHHGTAVISIAWLLQPCLDPACDCVSCPVTALTLESS